MEISLDSCIRIEEIFIKIWVRKRWGDFWELEIFRIANISFYENSIVIKNQIGASPRHLFFSKILIVCLCTISWWSFMLSTYVPIWYESYWGKAGQIKDSCWNSFLGGRVTSIKDSLWWVLNKACRWLHLVAKWFFLMFQTSKSVSNCYTK